MISFPRMGQTHRKHGYEAGTQCSVPFSKQVPDAGLCRQDSDCSEGTYNRQGQGTVTCCCGAASWERVPLRLVLLSSSK